MLFYGESLMSNLRPLLLDLFYHLRDDAQMPLTIDQFESLCQAVARGYGVEDWDQLRRVCRLLWVKPHESYAEERFVASFERYRERCEEAIRSAFSAAPITPPSPVIFRSGVLPQLPPRIIKGSDKGIDQSIDQSREIGADRPQPQQAVTAVQVAPATTAGAGSQFVLRQLPIGPRSVQTTWQRLRSLAAVGPTSEVDCDRTVAQMLRTGLLSEVVLRSDRARRGDLLLLVDDDGPMLPFRPAVQPLLDAVLARRMRPAVVYRFTTYPVDYFYQWQRPTEAVAVSTVLSRLHRQRTMVMIVSDAGAASLSYNPARLQRTGQFLARLLPCVRDVLWLNPLPRERWAGTSAATLAKALNGRMVALEELGSRQQDAAIAEVQLWSVMS
jgi:uncharacterized protein